MKLETRMRQSINRRSGSIILRSDVAQLGSKTQISHILNLLIKKGELYRLANGIFIKTKKETNNSSQSAVNLAELIQELTTKLDLNLYDKQLPPFDGSNANITTIVIEVTDPRIDKRLSINGKTIHFVSHKKASTNKTPTCVAQLVKKLANQYGISYQDEPKDHWANTITHIAGDEVKSDPIKDLIIALKRAGKISKKQVADLMASYLKEQRYGVWSLQRLWTQNGHLDNYLTQFIAPADNHSNLASSIDNLQGLDGGRNENTEIGNYSQTHVMAQYQAFEKKRQQSSN